MRRLPIYFLVDVSESMAGEPIEQVQEEIEKFIRELRKDPYSIETVFVSVIAFADKAMILSPLTELAECCPPTFQTGGGTSLGAAMNCLMDDIDKSVVKTTAEVRGDRKPIIFLFINGAPTDNTDSAFSRWDLQYRGRCHLFAVSIDDSADTEVLTQITDNVFRLKDTNCSSLIATIESLPPYHNICLNSLKI